MSGYSADLSALRTATSGLDDLLARAHDLVRDIDLLAIPATSFGGIASSVAVTYAGLHERKMAALESVLRRLHGTGDLVDTLANLYQARDLNIAERQRSGVSDR